MTAAAFAHPAISRFAIADGMLHIGGFPVELLAERADANPFFAYGMTASPTVFLGHPTPTELLV